MGSIRSQMAFVPLSLVVMAVASVAVLGVTISRPRPRRGRGAKTPPQGRWVGLRGVPTLRPSWTDARKADEHPGRARGGPRAGRRRLPARPRARPGGGAADVALQPRLAVDRP